MAIEVRRLQELEAVIERGLNTFVEVGQALLEIRDSRLYREGHATFEDYCRERWGMVRRNANRLIAAAQTIANLGPIGPILPATESQARPLTALEPEQQREAWARAVETAPDGKVTASHVQSIVDDLLDEDSYSNEEIAQACRDHGETPPTRPHVSYNTGVNEWYTPPEYIAAARQVMGYIELDPASSAQAQRIVLANHYIDEEGDGLQHRWWGKVWMNPPYAAELIGQFTQKLATHFVDGDVPEAVVLVNNATETGWFQGLLKHAAAVCFPRGRIRFTDPAGNSGAPLQGQAILYLGDHADSFAEHFGAFGIVLFARV